MDNISLIVLFVLPTITFLIATLGYFFDNKKRGVLYSILMALSIGVIVYSFVPKKTYDLYRHHLVVQNIINNLDSGFIVNFKSTNIETIPYIISYIAAIFKNENLIQFITVSLGYMILFLVLNDYRKVTNLRKSLFTCVFLFTIFGFNALNFISGLWYYLAIIIFFLACYLDYIKHKSKKLVYPLYILALLCHNSMFFALIILILYKLYKNKIKLSQILIALVIFLASTQILTLVANLTNFSILKSIVNMYELYLTYNGLMYQFYDFPVMIIEVSKLIITLIAIYISKKEKNQEEIYGLTILMTICTISMLPKSIVMIRFIMLIQFLGVIPLMQSLKESKEWKIIYLGAILLFTIIYILYFYFLFDDQVFNFAF